MVRQNSIDLLASLCTDLISQIAEPHASLPQNLKIKHEQSTKRAIKNFFPSQRMNGADLFFDNIRMS